MAWRPARSAAQRQHHDLSGLLAFANTFTNTGAIVATGGTITIAGTFATTGTFTANNTKLNIGGTISGGSLLALLNNSSDTVTYTATYENTGRC